LWKSIWLEKMSVSWLTTLSGSRTSSLAAYSELDTVPPDMRMLAVMGTVSRRADKPCGERVSTQR